MLNKIHCFFDKMGIKNKIVLLTICSIFFGMFVEKFLYDNSAFNFSRFALVLFVTAFAISNVFFDRKKIWDFLFKKRYLVGGLLFVFFVISGYHGSSINIYDQLIEPNIKVKNTEQILGQNRDIRGDEWAVNSPSVLSQLSSTNNLSKINSNLMAIKKNVTLYQKYPAKSITILSTPGYIGFLFLDVNMAFSFYWFLPYFLLFFGSFELLLILTNDNKKYSFVGALLIVFSPIVSWWECAGIIGYGNFAVVCFYKYLKEKKFNVRILYLILIGIFGSCYIMCMYPAWLLTYGYIYLGIVIWMIIKQKKEINLKKILLLFLVVISTIGIIVIPSFLEGKEVYKLITSTIYPGARFSVGGSGWELLFNYFVSLFTPFKNIGNASEASQFMSFYPIPILMTIYYCFRDRKQKNKNWLLIILVTITILLNVWNYIKLPNIIAKISLLYMSTPGRSQVVIGYSCILLLIICMNEYENKAETNIKKIIFSRLGLIKIIIAFLITTFGIYLAHKFYPDLISIKVIIIAYFTFISGFSLILLNTQKTNKILSVYLLGIAILSGMTVHPLSKGVDIIYKKPLAQKIQQTVHKNKNSKWITVSTNYTIQNYVAANGAKIINSTNYFPNYILWKKLDPKNKYENVWNRYAHVTIDLVDTDTNVSLLYPDAIKINLKKEDLCKINVNYIVTELDLDKDKMISKKIYKKDNIAIYKTICD